MTQPTLTLTLTESDVLAIRAALVGKVRNTDVERADEWRSAWQTYERFTDAHERAEAEAAAEDDYWSGQAARCRDVHDDATEWERSTGGGR